MLFFLIFIQTSTFREHSEVMNNYAHLLYICILIYQLFTVECTVKNVWWYAADTDNDRPYNFSLKGQVANRLSTILLCSIFPCCLYFLINYSS